MMTENLAGPNSCVRIQTVKTRNEMTDDKSYKCMHYPTHYTNESVPNVRWI